MRLRLGLGLDQLFHAFHIMGLIFHSSSPPLFFYFLSLPGCERRAGCADERCHQTHADADPRGEADAARQSVLVIKTKFLHVGWMLEVRKEKNRRALNSKMLPIVQILHWAHLCDPSFINVHIRRRPRRRSCTGQNTPPPTEKSSSAGITVL